MDKKTLESFGFAKSVRVGRLVKGEYTYEDEIIFRKNDGEKSTILVPIAHLHERKHILPRLQNADAMLPTDPADIERLLGALRNTIPGQRQTELPSCGWIGAPRPEAYAVGPMVIGAAPEGARTPWQTLGSAIGPSRMGLTGTADEWTREVASLARFSSSMILSLGCAFAAPLLRLLELPSRIFVLTGKRRSGKTSASLLAASVIGTAREEDLLTWSTTGNRLGERLPWHNDSLLVLDDLKSLPERSDDDKIRAFDQFCYEIASGRTKERYKDTHATEWKTVVLTQNESLLDAMSRAPRAGGAQARGIDVPIFAEGTSHIFDLWRPLDEGELDSSEGRSRWFARIAQNCAAFHGSAIEKYIGHILTDLDGSTSLVRKSMDMFVAHAVTHNDGDDVRDLARSFSILYGGLVLAEHAGLVPWDRKHSGRAIMKCFRRARAVFRDDAFELQNGLNALRAALIALDDVRNHDDLVWIDFEKVLGFRDMRSQPSSAIIKNDAYNALFDSDAQQRLVTRYLLEQGHLRRSDSSSSGKKPEPMRQFSWPDGKRRRSLQISLDAVPGPDSKTGA